MLNKFLIGNEKLLWSVFLYVL